MNNFSKILPDTNYYNRITLHTDRVPRHRKMTYVRFGNQCCEVTIDSSSELEKNEILLSTNVIETLGVPLQPLYQLKRTDYEIEIGPYIGILAYRQKKNLDDSVSILSNYLYDYPKIGGAVVTFSAEGVDMEKQQMEGYVYNPESKLWEKGQFPYPAVLFKRAGMGKKLRNHFHSILKDNIFNSYIFNKWEMHQWLEEFSNTKPFLPETILYEDPEDVLWFLKTFKEAFIKPINGSQGAGIIRGEKIASVCVPLKNGWGI